MLVSYGFETLDGDCAAGVCSLSVVVERSVAVAGSELPGVVGDCGGECRHLDYARGRDAQGKRRAS